MTRVLVLGGVRSGKSRYAERLLRTRSAVTYVATGPVVEVDARGRARDPDWAARVADHRGRRPVTWRTRESRDLPAALDGHGAPAAPGELPADTPRPAILIDCLGTWLTGLIDDEGAWDDLDRAAVVVDRGRRGLIAALARTTTDVVLVSNEVGLGVVPATASGRFFRDELGRLNAAVADVCDKVVLIVAGRVLDLPTDRRVDDVEPL